MTFQKFSLILLFFMFCSLSFAQIALKDKNGATIVEINETGVISFKQGGEARMEEYGKNDENGQNVRFHGKDGQVVANFIAKKQVLLASNKKVLAQMYDDGSLKDKASGKKMNWSEKGELVLEGKKTGLFLEPYDDLFKERTLMIAYLTLMLVDASGTPAGDK